MTATITQENPKVHIGKKCMFQVTSIQNYDVSMDYVIKVMSRSGVRLIAPIIHPLSGKIVFMVDPIRTHIEYFELLNVKNHPVLVNYSLWFSSISPRFFKEVKNSYVFLWTGCDTIPILKTNYLTDFMNTSWHNSSFLRCKKNEPDFSTRIFFMTMPYYWIPITNLTTP